MAMKDSNRGAQPVPAGVEVGHVAFTVTRKEHHALILGEGGHSTIGEAIDALYVRTVKNFGGDGLITGVELELEENHARTMMRDILLQDNSIPA